jgi:hypothetical protein
MLNKTERDIGTYYDKVSCVRKYKASDALETMLNSSTMVNAVMFKFFSLPVWIWVSVQKEGVLVDPVHGGPDTPTTIFF